MRLNERKVAQMKAFVFGQPLVRKFQRHFNIARLQMSEFEKWPIDVQVRFTRRIGATVVCGPMPKAVEDWLASEGCGMAALTLCKHFFGEPVDAGNYHPTNPLDLSCCLTFLDIAFGNGAFEQLDSARHLSPYWDAYMYHWNELVSLFEKETQGAKGGLWKAPETYNLMLKIQDGVRQQEKVHNRDKSQYRGWR